MGNYYLLGIAVVVVLAAILFILVKKILYKTYTVEVWGDVLEAGKDPNDLKSFVPFPEQVKGPNLRQNKITKQWQIGREDFVPVIGTHRYSWRSVGSKIVNEIFTKIESGKKVQVVFKASKEVIIASG